MGEVVHSRGLVLLLCQLAFSLSSLRPQVTRTARKGEIKKIKARVCQICKVHCLTAGLPGLAGHGGGFSFRLCSYVKIMWAEGGSGGVIYMGHKKRELEFGCSNWKDLGGNFYYKIKKILAE